MTPAQHLAPPIAGDDATDSRTTAWRILLRDALLTPGLVHEAYRCFHQYSVRNQLLALAQCAARHLRPGPIATFKQWQRRGRIVLRGQKALTLCMPVTVPIKTEDQPEEDTDDTAAAVGTRMVFVYRARWFVLSQTDGAPYEPATFPNWDEETALDALSITRVAFDELNGNVQGYSIGRSIAVSPVAALPHKTLFHELGHIALGHTEPGCTVARAVQELAAESVALLSIDALDLPGSEYARGYLQSWATSEDLTDKVANSIMRAADTILRAGRTVANVPDEAESTDVRYREVRA